MPKSSTCCAAVLCTSDGRCFGVQFVWKLQTDATHTVVNSILSLMPQASEHPAKLNTRGANANC